MGKGFGGLRRRLLRRGSQAASLPSTADRDEAELDGVALGPPPELLPAAIFHQVLYDPNELTPAWLRPRATVAPAPNAPPEPKLAKRTRRAKATLSSTPAPTRTRAKKTVAKPHRDATKD